MTQPRGTTGARAACQEGVNLQVAAGRDLVMSPDPDRLPAGRPIPWFVELALAEERSVFVARDADVAALFTHFKVAKTGKSTVVRVSGPFGGGRRAVVGDVLRKIQTEDTEAILWRVVCLDQEDGVQWLVRMYGSLVASLTSDPARRGRVELALNQALPTQPKRVQGWIQEFVQTLRESKTDAEKGAVQLRLPRDNPLIGLVEITSILSRRFPIVLDIQNVFSVYSVLPAQFLEAAFTEGRNNQGKLLVLLHDETETDATKAMHPMPLVDLYARRAEDFVNYAVAPWGVEEVERYLTSKDWSTKNAADISRIAQGRPGFVAELADILSERNLLEADLSSASFASLSPIPEGDATAEETEAEPPEEGKRKAATEKDLARIAFFAGLLGQAFPSGLVADMGGWDRDSVDDLLDAQKDLFEEVQFAQDMQMWIYKFRRGSYREGVMERNDSELGHRLAQQVGVFMERFLVPRSKTFIPRTARVYAEHGAPGRAGLMRSLALTNDNADVWGLGYDLTRFYDEITWPDALKRTLYMNLLERLLNTGNLQVADQVHADATAWATSKEDRDLTAWLLYTGSRVDARRSDLYRARDRARDALKLYEALGNDARRGEVLNHLAAVELQDGNPNAAMENVNLAIKAGEIQGPDGKPGVLPQIFANAEHIRGLVARQGGRLAEAAEHFRRANEVAGQMGIAGLALDAGLAFGEALLASGQTDKARDVLERVVQITVGVQNAARERAARELLGQAEGLLHHYDQALANATRVLQLSQALRYEHTLPIDLFNLGYFNLALQKPTEALVFFKQAIERLQVAANHPFVKDLWFHTGQAHLAVGNDEEARQALRACLRPTQQAKDWKRMVNALEQLSGLESKRGNTNDAKKLLSDAIVFAERAGLKEERKTLRRKLEAL